MSDYVPFTVLSAIAELNHSMDGWTLLDAQHDESRTYRLPVTFERSFSAAPVVHVGISGLDASNEDNLRLRVRAVDVASNGFVIEVHTWLNTRIWSVHVAWLAIGM